MLLKSFKLKGASMINDNLICKGNINVFMSDMTNNFKSIIYSTYYIKENFRLSDKDINDSFFCKVGPCFIIKDNNFKEMSISGWLAFSGKSWPFIKYEITSNEMKKAFDKYLKTKAKGVDL